MSGACCAYILTGPCSLLNCTGVLRITLRARKNAAPIRQIPTTAPTTIPAMTPPLSGLDVSLPNALSGGFVVAIAVVVSVAVWVTVSTV